MPGWNFITKNIKTVEEKVAPTVLNQNPEKFIPVIPLNLNNGAQNNPNSVTKYEQLTEKNSLEINKQDKQEQFVETIKPTNINNLNKSIIPETIKNLNKPPITEEPKITNNKEIPEIALDQVNTNPNYIIIKPMTQISHPARSQLRKILDVPTEQSYHPLVYVEIEPGKFELLGHISHTDFASITEKHTQISVKVGEQDFFVIDLRPPRKYYDYDHIQFSVAELSKLTTINLSKTIPLAIDSKTTYEKLYKTILAENLKKYKPSDAELRTRLYLLRHRELYTKDLDDFQNKTIPRNNTDKKAIQITVGSESSTLQNDNASYIITSKSSPEDIMKFIKHL